MHLVLPMRPVKVRKGQKLAGFSVLPYLLSRVDICPITLLAVDSPSREKLQSFGFDLHFR